MMGNKKAGNEPAFLFGATAYIVTAAPAAPAPLALRRELDLRRELLRAVFLRAAPLRAVFLRPELFRAALLRVVFLRVLFLRAPPLRAVLRAPPLRAVFLRAAPLRAPLRAPPLRAVFLRAVFLRAPAFLRPPFFAAAMIASPIGVHLPGVPPVGRLGTARGLILLARAVTNSAHFAQYEFVTTREYTDRVFARQYFSYRFRHHHQSTTRPLLTMFRS